MLLFATLALALLLPPSPAHATAPAPPCVAVSGTTCDGLARRAAYLYDDARDAAFFARQAGEQRQVLEAKRRVRLAQRAARDARDTMKDLLLGLLDCACLQARLAGDDVADAAEALAHHLDQALQASTLADVQAAAREARDVAVRLQRGAEALRYDLRRCSS